MEKVEYRGQIAQLIEKKLLFVDEVNPENAGQHRADYFSVIFPIYKVKDKTQTLANCFCCNNYKFIFLNKRSQGTGPFTSHRCYKAYLAKLEKAENEAEQAKKIADEATAKANAVVKAVENLRSPQSAKRDIDPLR